jgi:hypothetical protein
MDRYRGPGPFRQRSRVQWSDPDFSVRAVSIEDLVRVQYDNLAHQLTRRWSSEEALRRQVRSDSTAFLCPLFRNGGPEEAPESYKCWIWFVLGSEEHARGVSLIDVGNDMFSTLPEASSPDQLKRVVLAMMEGIAEGSRFEAIW